MNSHTALLETRYLVKHFHDVKAVNGINLSISAGICFGLLGPNGAGKTTTVEMLEGLKRPTQGEILYKGEPLGERFHQEAGIMFQSTALQDYLTTLEALRLFQKFYGRTMSIEYLIERCALSTFLDRDTHKLSGGQLQRLLLAIALINDPSVVFLDEPTTGLDPQSRRNFWSLVEDIRTSGKTIVLTTHYMEEAYQLCDEIAIMDHGHIIAQGAPRALLAEHFNDVILQLPLAAFPMPCEQLPITFQQRGDQVEITTPDINQSIRLLLSSGVSLTYLQIRTRNLDDLFLELTGKELRT